MNTFYFGASDRPLYGVYHQPTAERPARAGVVLCYPFGQEYMRAHRAFRQLALLLSKRGWHVLRFDYHATGDSSGEGEEGQIGQWLFDVGAAIDELKETAGLDAVSLVGLRLGALLAARGAAGRGDLRDLVLWDPVVRGDLYIDEVLTRASHVEHHPSGLVGVNGFPLSPQLMADVRALSLLGPLRLGARRVHLALSHQRPEFQQLADHLRREEVPVTAAVVGAPSDWNQVDDFGGVLIPQAIIQEIVTWLTAAPAA